MGLESILYCSEFSQMKDRGLEDSRVSRKLVTINGGLCVRGVRREMETENNRYAHTHRSVPCGTQSVYATCACMLCA